MIEKILESSTLLAIVLIIPGVIKQLRLWHLGYLENKKDNQD